MSENTLTATIRKKTGKGYARALRRDDKIPGVFYIHGEDAVPLTFEAKQIINIIASKPALITLKCDDGFKKEVVVRDVQRDPITSAITHVDLMGIKRGVKITVSVPVHLAGEPEGVKTGGILEHLTRELEIECLPKHLLEILEVDVSALDIGDSLHVHDLSFENIKILTREDVSIANVVLPKAVVAEEVPAEVEEEEEKVEAEAEEKPAETTDEESAD